MAFEESDKVFDELQSKANMKVKEIVSEGVRAASDEKPTVGFVNLAKKSQGYAAAETKPEDLKIDISEKGLDAAVKKAMSKVDAKIEESYNRSR